MFQRLISAVQRRIPFTTVTLALTIVCSVPNIGQQTTLQNLTPPQPRNANDVFADLGRAVPEFGGMFVDEQRNDTLDVYVLGNDPSLAARLDVAINAIPELAMTRAQQTQIKLLAARYTFLQLKEWHDRMSVVLLGHPSVVLTAIDQQANRLLVGVEDFSAEAEVAAELARLGIPRAAIKLEFMQNLEETPAVHEPGGLVATNSPGVTLQSKIRPLVGGIEITHKEGDSVFACTLGFIAERSRVSGIVTNSHCTEVAGGVENTIFYQPSPEDADKVAVESVDPCYFWRGPEPTFPPNCEPLPHPIPAEDKCEENEACRYSDSAFATLDRGVQASLGFIARPTRERSLDWDPPDTFFKIVGEQSVVVQRTPVSMVGRTTGWRTEVVAQVCANRKITRTVRGRQQVYDYICQNLSSGAGDSGDSGSPVFACIDNSNPPRIIECPGRLVEGQKNVNVRLVGIRWGLLGGSPRFAVYSPIGSMSDGRVKGVQNSDNDLGPLKKCAEGDC